MIHMYVIIFFSETISRGQEVLCETPSESDRADNFGNFFRMRSTGSMSVGSTTSNDTGYGQLVC